MAHSDFSHLAERKVAEVEHCRSLNVGDKIRFREEKRPYTVKAKSTRYLICTKPLNVRHTCLYTIVDLERLVRGTNNLVFNMYEYTHQEDIDRCLADLEAGKIEVSHRNCVMLEVEVAEEE